MSELTWSTGALDLVIAWRPDAMPSILSATAGETRLDFQEAAPLAHVLTSSSGHALSSSRLAMSALGPQLRPVDVRRSDTNGQRHIDLEMEAEKLRVTVRLSAADGVAALTSTTTVRNDSDEPVTLLGLTSWTSGLGAAEGYVDWTAHVAATDWLAENRWEQHSFRTLFPRLANELTGHRPRGQFATVSHGTWSSGTHLPMLGASSVEQRACWLWSVDHNGAWRTEIGQENTDFSVAIGGPNDRDHGWFHTLAPGEEFTSVPATVALGSDLTTASAALTAHRRAFRRSHPDNAAMPVIFNDYMNTLNGDPTTEKLIPLIDAAAEVGAEIFCIDAGWYDDGGDWWPSVGEWLPSTTRFPGGLGEVIDRIKSHGMVAGLWVEPEVVGVDSPLATQLPPEAFMQRGGVPLVEHERHHLDFRHPAAREHLDGVIDRLVADFGVGYFKFDYNINPGPGSDLDSPSVGDALLEHNRAVLTWLDGIYDRHPGLVIENCGSGAMRSDWAMLSRMQVQSTSDQQDFTLYPPIAAAAPMGMLPEQAASWAYPQPSMTLEETTFCLVTGILGRFFLSGYLNEMDDEHLSLVRESVQVAKQLREEIQVGTPFWPLGLPQWDDEWVALGLQVGGDARVSVWHRGDATDTVELSLEGLTGAGLEVHPVLPTTSEPWRTAWHPERGVLAIHDAPSLSARTFRLVRPEQ